MCVCISISLSLYIHILGWHYLSNTAAFVSCVVYSLDDSHSLLHDSPLLKRPALDK